MCFMVLKNGALFQIISQLPKAEIHVLSIHVHVHCMSAFGPDIHVCSSEYYYMDHFILQMDEAPMPSGRGHCKRRKKGAQHNFDR